MKTIKQLYRQPLKTLLGIILLTLAAAVLCVTAGQTLAAVNTKKDLDERFSTMAIASYQEDLSGSERITVEDELLQWLQKVAQEHPDIVKGLAPNGFLSAYIPQLQPYNPQSREHVDDHAWDAMLYTSGNNFYAGTTHYDSAMLVITLDTISQITTPTQTAAVRDQMPDGMMTKADDWIFHLWELRHKAYQKHQEYQFFDSLINLLLENTMTYGYTVELTGSIEQTVFLPDGMRDPVGMTARLNLTLPSPEAIEALGLVPGQQYIVYGMDYVDDYQMVVEFLQRSTLSKFKHITFDPFDPALLEEPEDYEIKSYLENKRINPVMLYNFVPLEQWQYERINTVSMTLCLPSNLIPYEEVRNESGELVDCIPKTQVSYTDQSGQTHKISVEDLDARYTLPLIAPLNGNAQAFLDSQEGEQWRAALEQSRVNNHAFSVVGINDMHQLGSFALNKAQMGEGREFTAEEVESGAKVCIIHEWVADKAGLQLGDTITLGFYATDYASPYLTTSTQQWLLQKSYDAAGRPFTPATSRETGLLRPSAGLYSDNTPILETGEYTIVGFWKGSLWPDMEKEYYNFSANTVLVPAASVQTAMEYRSSLPFVSVVLENGTIRQFHELAKRSGYAGRFTYNDQGYSDIAMNFHNYEALARQIMLVGITIYVILLLLYLLMYPASQGKVVWIMESMGCNYGRRFAYVLRSSMLIMVTAAVLGGWLGTLLWDRMVAMLQQRAQSTIALQLDVRMLAIVAAAQLLLGLVLSGFVAVFVALPRGIAKRR